MQRWMAACGSGGAEGGACQGSDIQCASVSFALGVCISCPSQGEESNSSKMPGRISATQRDVEISGGGRGHRLF